MNRSGVALIIAISVLAALLFLALPFVFSQSSSVAGARAASWDGGARRGSDRALGLATALTTYATGLHRSPALALQLGTAQMTYVQLPMQIGDQNGPIRYWADAPNSWRTIIDTASPWATNAGSLPSLDSAGVVHGTTIEDESRRIEPNCLDMYGWAVVLKRAGIQDPWTVAWHWDLSLPNKGAWSMLTYGRLARALTYWRPGNGSRRFNRLEDLLGADPQQPEQWYGVNSHLGCVHFGPLWNYPVKGQSGWPPGMPGQASVEGQTVEDSPAFGREVAEVDPLVKDSANLGWRVAPLTQAELERLRPLLSFLIPGQGRSGLIDLGTVVAPDALNSNVDKWGVVTDELAPTDTGVVGGAVRTSHTWIHGGTASQRYLDDGWAKKGDPLGVDAIPSLNLNTVPSSSGMTRLYLAQDYAGGESDAAFQIRIEGENWPNDPIDTPITSYGHMPRLRWLDPRTGDGSIMFERPPLGIAGFGIVAIEGLSTVRDQQGNAVASRRRRTVVQAVPQERPIEAAWTTQGDFEALVRLRHGSWVVAGPHPTNRIADWGADAATGQQDMLALDGPGWLEPAPLTTFARNPAVRFQWRVPFGLTKAQPWDDVLKSVDANSNLGQAPNVLPNGNLRASGTTPGILEAQGLRLTPGDRIAWAADTANGGPLQFNVNGNEHEFTACHIALRFCLPDAPSATTTIVEVRNQEPTRDTTTPADGIADALTGAQSAWRIEYRPADSLLVLVIANAALPWTDDDRARFGLAAWTAGADLATDTSDARCRPDALPFAPADPATVVEFRYHVDLQPGQWYHLQAFCAADRPGLHGLILDGVVGRDATQAGVDMSRTGDHYTYPSLRLTAPIAMPGSLPATGTALVGSDIAVRFPAGVALAQLLPTPRGMVRIDDEYFSYTSQTDNGDGTGTLGGVQRARRVNTDQTATEDLDNDGVLDQEDANGNGVLDVGEDANGNGVLDMEDANLNGVLDATTDAHRWPVLQQHEAGALVTPGWAQKRLVNGRWLRGKVQLVGPFEKPIDALTPRPPLAKVPKSGGTLPPPNAFGDVLWTHPDEVTIEPTDWDGDGNLWTWGDRGYVEFWIVGDITGRTGRCYFTRAGTKLTLDWTKDAAPLCDGGLWGDVGSGLEVRAVQVSVNVEGEVNPVGGKQQFDASGTVQILDPGTGRAEWVRYTDLVDHGVADRFFVRRGGGFNRDPAATPSPLGDTRGSMRTDWSQTDSWADRSIVLPVQTSFDSDRFESGDVVTLVRQQIDDAGAPGGRWLPVQVVVRHACRDGYPAAVADSGAAWDTRNEYFALAHQVPDSVPDPSPLAPGVASPVLAIIGRGWGGDDLSPEGNDPERRGVMPRLDLLIATTGDKAKVHFGGADNLSLANTSAVLLDDLCAGPLQGPADANQAAAANAVNGSEIIAIGGSTSGTIGAAAADLPVMVQASGNLFATVNNNDQYGLALIDGEAFAFRRIAGDNARATLIARALLGTVAQPHRLASAAPLLPGAGAATRTVWPTLPITILPLGPVAELCSPLAQGAHNVGVDVVEALYENYYKDPIDFTHPSQESYAQDPNLLARAPFVLVHHASDGASVEIARLLGRPASRQRITASWLRGLYGTPDTAWAAPYTPATHLAPWSSVDPGAQLVNAQSAGALNPIIIGWWPRFAPGQTGSPTAESLRSRSFAWAGFALRLSGSRFDGHEPSGGSDPGGAAVLRTGVGGIADIDVASDAGCALTASALAAEEASGVVFDWDSAWANRSLLSMGANTGLVRPFDWTRFWLKEVDGAELRVHWAATGNGASDLIRAGDAAGRAPRLENIRLRCVAPSRVLAVEEVR